MRNAGSIRANVEAQVGFMFSLAGDLPQDAAHDLPGPGFWQPCLIQSACYGSAMATQVQNEAMSTQSGTILPCANEQAG